MGLIVTIIIGFFVGLVAKFLMPGRDPGGFIITALLGVGGALTANYLGHAMGLYAVGDAAGFIASVLGAMILLGIYRVFSNRGMHQH